VVRLDKNKILTVVRGDRFMLWLIIGIMVGIVIGVPLTILLIETAFSLGWFRFLPW
jgi:hypothetical protein